MQQEGPCKPFSLGLANRQHGDKYASVFYKLPSLKCFITATQNGQVTEYHSKQHAQGFCIQGAYASWEIDKLILSI